LVFREVEEAERRAAMTIEIRKPELERLVREEILSGQFKSVDDLLTEALQALREKNAPSMAAHP
jgi:Arc/MetJ-type ribon-helix-helix transcriptional regulator